MRKMSLPIHIRIPKIHRRRRAKPAPGAAPGTLVMSAELPRPALRRCSYGEEQFEEAELCLDDLEAAVAAAGERAGVTWIDVQGLGDEQAIRRLGTALGLHPLTLEDIVHVHQRPKVEAFDDHLFIVLRCVRLLGDGSVDSEQISMVLRPGLLVTFQERPGDGFEPVRRRLRDGKPTFRRSGADYLAGALLDLVIDLAFPVVEAYGDSMDRLDDEVMDRPSRQTSSAIHALKRELRQLRRALWPLRDAVAALLRDEHPLIGAPVKPMLRDCHDHALQLADFIEGARERAADLYDRYLAEMAERTNQVMKVLTVIATIFIPLTYLAGIYGMNFDTGSPYNMPELGWRYGYLGFWALNATMVVGMLLFFRSRGWLGGGAPPADRR